MRKIIILLSLSTLSFAALSAYLASELRSRDRAAAQTTLAAECPVAQPNGPLANWVRPASITPAPPAAEFGCDAHRAAMDSAQARAQARYQAQLARDLADPEKRAAMVEQGKKSLRSQEPRLAEYLGMKDLEFDALLTLLADQGVQYQEWFQNCQKTHCTWNEEFPAFEARKRRAIEELLGAERNQRYQQYDQSRAERMAVGNFRKDLPDALRMSDEQSERLILALTDERQKFESEVRSRGLETSGFGAGRGMIYWDNSHRSVEERVAAGRRYSERLRTRAADILSADQLREYARTQDAELASMENSLPYHDSLNAAGLPSATGAN